MITGEAKGRKLKGPPDIRTRPMQDKIKEAVFCGIGIRWHRRRPGS